MTDWPQQIATPHVLGNFRQRTPKKHKNSDWRNKRPGMSPKHLELIRQLPCSVCPSHPAGTCHHIKAGTGERGASVRSTDRWTVPLCTVHHDEVERVGTRNEIAWFRDHGINAHELASALWSGTGDLGRMIRILIAHKQANRSAAR